jgi:hypothetical protein
VPSAAPVTILITDVARIVTEIRAGNKAFQSRTAADEYDAAQERGEVASNCGGVKFRYRIPGVDKIATAKELGINPREIHDAASSAMPRPGR